LVELIEHHGNEQAAMAVARLIANGQGAQFGAYLKPGGQWLSQVLSQMPQLNIPISPALPLVVQALNAGVLERATVMAYIKGLKASGAWGDAYGLWLALNGKSLPTLFNAGFDEPFQPEGFDWETPAKMPANKTGAIVEQRGAEGRGAILGINFTGRTLPVPLARQSLFLGEGRYRLRGEYTSNQLRMEQGLAWTIRCTTGGAVPGRSEALGETAGIWRTFTFEFSIPPDCGLVAHLQLETFAPYDAALGARGRVDFDAFALEKVTR
jgi:hypothetical protein